ncbi:MAG: hypothetical protein WD600_07805, partial [Pseudohongiella sp.]
GVEPWSANELQAYTRMSPAMIESALQILMAIEFIRATDESPPCYLPVSTVNNCKLHELRRKLRFYAKDRLDIRSCCEEQMQIRKVLDEAEASWAETCGDITLPDLIASSDTESKS